MPWQFVIAWQRLIVVNVFGDPHRLRAQRAIKDVEVRGLCHVISAKF